MKKDFTKALKGINKEEEIKEAKETKEPSLLQELDKIVKDPDNAEAKLNRIKEYDKSTFSFKASSEVLKDLRALATIKHRTQAELIEEAIIMYFEANLEDYKQALRLRKEFNL